MNSDEAAAQSTIKTAMQALKNGDRRAARHLAEQAAALAPQTEQPWLLLAYLASPKAALYYLDRALEANPTSQRALAGKTWLNKQLLESAPFAGAALPVMLTPDEATQPTPTIQVSSGEPARAALPGIFPPAEDTRPTLTAAAALAAPADSTGAALPSLMPPVEDTRPTPTAPPSQAAWPARLRVRPLAWLVGFVVLVALLGGIAAMTNATRQADSQDANLARIVQTVLNAQPTLESSPTPSLTATTEPTATATTAPTLTATALPTSTRTASPSPTSTPTAKPTATPLPTATLVKNTPVVNTTYSVVPGDTLNLIALRYNIALQSLINANNLTNPSLIKAGQVLTIPSSGSLPPASQPTTAPVPAGPSGNGKEIQIDISEQHLYAYQNGELVYSLVVSTGIGNSTRIGTFKVLDKIPNAWSNAFSIWMPYWLGIYYSGTLENGIHGLPLLTNGVELWGNLLGKPATYGCIESRTPDIKKLYNWAEIGTPVIIRR